MEKPNFFLIGAPKCATTALAAHLREHKKIFFSTPKELHFFNDDADLTCPIKPRDHDYSLEKYLSYFKNATKEHIAIGEGSTTYLFSKNAVKNILQFNPDAKFVVIIRNPIDMFFSLHAYSYFSGMEDEPNPKKAWDLQEKRKRGEKLPSRWFSDTDLEIRKKVRLIYGDVCSTGRQIQRLFKTAKAEKIQVILYDELVDNFAKVYQDLLSFLEVPFDGRIYLSTLNKSKSNKKIVHPCVDACLRYIRNFIYKYFPAYINTPMIKNGRKYIRKTWYNYCYKDGMRVTPSADFLKELKNFFKDDIWLLSDLLNRDLSYWIR